VNIRRGIALSAGEVPRQTRVHGPRPLAIAVGRSSCKGGDVMKVKEWLEKLSSTTQSEEQDSAMMRNLLHRCGFPLAVVVYGIVYLEGHGTMDAPPTSIHSIAKMLLKAA